MRYIAPIAVAAVILLQLSGAIPQSSVGGPLTIAFVFLLAALAVGIGEAWTNRRGVLGWIVSIVVALVGAIVAGLVGGTLMDTVMPFLYEGGPLVQTRHLLLYLTTAAMMLVTLLGAWLALWAVNRVR